MKYAYEIQPSGKKTIYIFPDDSSRAAWIVASNSNRGVLSGNSKAVKAALYFDQVIFTSLQEKEIQTS